MPKNDDQSPPNAAAEGAEETKANTQTSSQEEKKDSESPGNKSFQARLAELREQLEALHAGRAEADDGEGSVRADLGTQIREFIGKIDDDLKDASPTTLLGVFALGVLTGRLLSR